MTAIELKMNVLNSHVSNGKYPSQINKQFLTFVRNYLIVRQIQNINALWEISVNSYDKNPFDQFNDFVTQLDFSSREIITDIHLLKKLKSEDSWLSVAETMKKNTAHENQSVGGWYDLYSPRKEHEISKNCCTLKNASEIYENCSVNARNVNKKLASNDAIPTNKNYFLQNSSSVENLKNFTLKMHHPKKEENQRFTQNSCELKIDETTQNSQMVQHKPQKYFREELSPHDNKKSQQNDSQPHFNQNSYSFKSNNEDDCPKIERRKWHKKSNTCEKETNGRSFYIKNKHNNYYKYEKSSQEIFKNLRKEKRINFENNNFLNENLRNFLTQSLCIG